MTSSARTAAANGGLFCGLLSGRAFFVMLALLALTLPAAAQTAVNPPTNTILFSGQTPTTVNTGPLGGIILEGTAISAITGLPVRHLWVADTFASVCRMDPEIGAPGPWDINLQTCTYRINSGGAPVPAGGQFAYDPTRKFLYFVDNITTGQGVIRIGFDPAGDSGHGALDFSTAFTLAGGDQTVRIGPFIGGTGCPYPFGAGEANGAALSPNGDLWVGFLDNGSILRFNSPATATEFGFGSCDQFMQVAATTPDAALSNGLAWIGHDLWSGDGTSPFVIPNADTTCSVPPQAACSTANGTVIPVLPAVGAINALEGDQKYPATNGNNLYFGAGSQIAWLGNASAAPAAQTLDVTYLNTGALVVDPALAAISGMGVDTTDPANLVVYSAEDPVILVNPLAIGGARWWQTSQPPAAPAAPGVPLHVVAVAGNAQVSLSWSPDQVAQPVTSYSVRNSFISSGTPIPDITVNPGLGGVFPPTSIVIPATNGVSYAFEVAASNANGTSAFSAQSNIVTPPGTGVPSTPGPVTAQVGDTQAVVTWAVSASNGGSPILSYTVTSNPGGFTVTVPPPTSITANTASALLGGLTNGTAYTFSVHATNIIGDSAESAPSNSITPSAAFVPSVSVSMSKPTDPTQVPAQLSYTITATNTSIFPAFNVNVTETLNQVPAGIASVSRNTTGIVTVTTTAPTSIAINQTVVIAGVADPSFNGTFVVSNNLSNTTFTYSQAGLGLPVATSSSGTATVQPLANIMAISTGSGVCTSAGPGVMTFSCNIGVMDPGAVARITFTVQMQNQTITNSATSSGTDIVGSAISSNTATVTTNAPAPPPSNNGILADLQLTGKATRGSAVVGTADGYTWVISNKGPNAAPNVVFTDSLPSSLLFSSVTTTAGSCTFPAVGSAGGSVSCSVPSLAINGTFTVTVNVIVNQKGTINNTGTATFNGTEAKPGNETVTVKITGQ